MRHLQLQRWWARRRRGKLLWTFQVALLREQFHQNDSIPLGESFYNLPVVSTRHLNNSYDFMASAMFMVTFSLFEKWLPSTHSSVIHPNVINCSFDQPTRIFTCRNQLIYGKLEQKQSNDSMTELIPDFDFIPHEQVWNIGRNWSAEWSIWLEQWLTQLIPMLPLFHAIKFCVDSLLFPSCRKTSQRKPFAWHFNCDLAAQRTLALLSTCAKTEEGLLLFDTRSEKSNMALGEWTSLH